MDYISNTEHDVKEMLQVIGIDNINVLFSDIPKQLILNGGLDLPNGLSEFEVKKLVEGLANKNKIVTSFLGAGSYQHFIHSVVNHILLRGEFFTSYTPYQPEASQGMLQAIYEYQTMICELTGMEVSNASLYEGASATAEAMLMAAKIKDRKKIIVSKVVHPEYRQVIKTYANANGIEVQEIGYDNGVTSLAHLENSMGNAAAVIVQYPNFFGCIERLSKIEKIVHDNGALFIVIIAEPTSLGILKSPGSFNADIVVGEGQSFGTPASFGGPYLGFIATRNEFVRRLPGRIAGMTVDSKGRDGFVLTLQAREQHIRREKATSNICTNEGLCMLAATVYLALMGKELRALADQNLQKAHYAFDSMTQLKNCKPIFSNPFYNEFVVQFDDASSINKKLLANGMIGGLQLENFYPELKDCVLFNVTEVHTREDIDRLIEVSR